MEIDNDLIRLIAETEKICSHLHIPLQSGDNKILKQMRRNYTREQYIEVIHRAINAIPTMTSAPNPRFGMALIAR
jgi:tRNA-2-methylthio-N6-dimethylallyladenosine synthase